MLLLGLSCSLCLFVVCKLDRTLVDSGHYDARARVLIRHVSCLLRVLPQQLEQFEETVGEKLREAKEESEYVLPVCCHIYTRRC